MESSGGLGVEPCAELCVSAFASKIGGGFVEVAAVMDASAVCNQQFDQIFAIGRGSGEEGRESACLNGIRVGAMDEEKADGVGIASEGHGGVQGLIALGILRDRVDTSAVVDEQSDGFRSAKSSGEVERSPSIY